jgi:hypothetical protein
MITTGRPTSSGTKTEVVDVVSGETCADLADFPLANFGAAGGNLHGTPVVCGGAYSTPYQKCYKLTISGWQEFASMKEKRWATAGVAYKNIFHVFGGHDGLNRLQTSEIINIDGGVEYGPDLPIAVSSHAITSINSTVSILSGGVYGGVTSGTSYSALTWYFNHDTGAFSSGPSLLKGRQEHGSATCVDKVTKAKIPIVTGGTVSGYLGSLGYVLDSTEVLINEQWQPGTIQF